MPNGKHHFDDLIFYWKTLSKLGDGVPQKTAFSPMQVYRLLPDLFFGERIAKYNIRLRLMGEAVETAARDVMPNRNIFEIVPEPLWDQIEQYYDRLCNQPCAGHVVRALTLENGLVYDLETISLPLADVNGDPRFVLGLVDLQQNHDNSVLAHQGAFDANSVAILEYWDLGYGIPSIEETKPIKRVS